MQSLVNIVLALPPAFNIYSLITVHDVGSVIFEIFAFLKYMNTPSPTT